MESSKGEKISCPSFSGEKGDFSVWWNQMFAFLFIAGFELVMQSVDVHHPDLPATYATGSAILAKAMDPNLIQAQKVWKENTVRMT